MRLEEHVYGPVVVLSPVGTIDLASSAAFQRRLLAATSRAGAEAPLVLVDMAGVSFISSAGLRALMIAAKEVQAAHGTIAVAALTRDVAEIFQIARFDLVVRLFADLRDALAWMSSDAAAAWDGR